MNIVIHAGRHKTGTTFLQTFFRNNSDTLLDKFGILYPVTGRGSGRNHHRFFKSVIYNENDKSSLIHGLLDEIARKGPGMVVMSSEVLSRKTITECSLRSLQHALSDHKVKLLFYLRQQDEYLLSLYAQHVKAGLIEYPHTIEDIEAELDYEAFLERYSAAFGEENILVRTYESAAARGMVEDVSTLIGASGITQLARPRAGNVRYTWLHIALLRAANRHALTRCLVRRRALAHALRVCARLMPSVFDRPIPLTAERRAKLREQAEQSNRRVVRKYVGQSEWR